MSEQEQQQQGGQLLPSSLPSISKQQVLVTGGTLVVGELAGFIADAAAHSTLHSWSVLGLAVTGLVAYNSKGVAKFLLPESAKDVKEKADRFINTVDPITEVHPDQRAISKIKRLVGLPSEPPTWPKDTSDDEDIYAEDEAQCDEEDVLMPPPVQKQGVFTFSSVLSKFVPSLDRIYLGVTLDGTPIYCKAEDLCHVALAGSTGGGKSSIMRLLMAQLCKAGAQVLLLNPHYTRYDLKSGEDWTPFEPYLHYDPMECRKYEVILHYLKYTTETLLRKRLDRYAHSLPLGKPYFIVLDELPSIIKHVPDAPGYLSELLREGRKVGIYLISASQDFLVKTIDPNGSGGAVRDCYRTAFYVGGDATTGKVMLDMAPKDIPESDLGKGAVMLRCAMASAVKKAKRAQVPYVDNDALYWLLGPSTYAPAQSAEMVEEPLPQPGRAPQQYAQPVPETPRPRMEPLQANPARRAGVVPAEIEQAIRFYVPGMSYRDLGHQLGYSDAEARALWQVLHQRYRHLLSTPRPQAATTVLDYEDEPQDNRVQLGKDTYVSREQFEIAARLRKTGKSTGYRDLIDTFDLSEHHAKVLNQLIIKELEACESERVSARNVR